MAKVRMQDIADQLGVSKVTVHNALSGQKGVSDALRKKILDVSRQMGYSQNPGKNEGPKSIGVLISEKWIKDDSAFYWKLYMEMALEAPNLNCTVMTEILKQESEEELTLPNFVKEKVIEGMVVLGEISRDYNDSLRSRTGIPIVYADFYYNEIAGDAVVTDGFYGMYLMTEYLYQRGFRRMAFVGSVHATSSIMDRFCGYQRALLEHDIPLRKDWVIEDREQMTGEIIFDHIPEELPEAFVCNCDIVACVLIDYLEKQGVRVPEDVSVVGFDNYLHPGLYDWGITTYEVDMKGIARTSLKKVLERIENPGAVKRIDLIAGHIVEKKTVKQRTADTDRNED